MDIPSGSIIQWFGSIGSIPSGFVLCDGNNGTPDLRNKFIVGAGDTYAVDETGGNIEHTHGFVGDGHNHTILGGSGVQGGVGINDITDTVQVTGTTQQKNGLPPFHSLAYIMRI